MSRFRVFFLPRARREYAIALAWWRVNRTAARTLLREEVRAARRLLARHPEAGPEDEAGTGVRRLLLQRTEYHIYYRVVAEERRVDILAVWHARRLPPDL